MEVDARNAKDFQNFLVVLKAAVQLFPHFAFRRRQVKLPPAIGRKCVHGKAFEIKIRRLQKGPTEALKRDGNEAQNRTKRAVL